MKTKILLADDHALLRGGLRSLLEDEDDLTVVGEAANGREAIALVGQLAPDVVVMDVTMPEVDGIEATRRVTGEFPEVKVIALTIHGGKRFVENMLGAGAAGYLLKDTPREALIQAIHDTLKTKIEACLFDRAARERAATRGESADPPILSRRAPG